MIHRLMALERQFWSYVERDQAPSADGSDSADLALRALYPQDSGQTLDLSQESDMSAAFSDLLAIRQDQRMTAASQRSGSTRKSASPWRADGLKVKSLVG